MTKYFCNHCGIETLNNRTDLSQDVHLCSDCYNEFDKLQKIHDDKVKKFTLQEDKIINDFLNIR